MRRYWPAIVALTVIGTSASAQQVAQAGAATAAAEVSVGTAIENRALTGAAESFARSVGKIYCQSKVTNAAGSEVEHVWYKGDTEVARVKLAVGGSPWRTHSSKTLGDDAAGDWRCDVVMNGNVIQTARFKVE
jgi:hypothetical protein